MHPDKKLGLIGGGLKPKRRMKINCHGLKAMAIQGDHSIKKMGALKPKGE